MENKCQNAALKAVAINGSPRKDGNTAAALDAMAAALEKQGIALEIIRVGHLQLHGCTACGHCAASEGNRCAFDDGVNEIVPKMREADGLILASPTYYAGIAGTMKCFLDRAFYSSSRYFNYKAATSITVVRRAGGVDALHQLNNYLNLAKTVIPPSQYWTSAFGSACGEVLQDSEGIQTLTANAEALGWLMRVLAAGKAQFPPPAGEPRVRMNFIR